MKIRLGAVTILTAMLSRGYAAAPNCTTLTPTKITLAPGASRCLTLTVNSANPIQVVIEQPVDLQIHVNQDGQRILVDSFEFGPETVTLNTPGDWELVIEPKTAAHDPLSFSIAQKAVGTHEGALFQAAEQAATNARRSGKPEDFRIALENWNRVGDLSAIGRASIDAGESAVASADLESARALFDSALQACRPVQDHRCLAAAANDGGWTTQQLGDFDRALELLSEASENWRRIGDRTRQGQTESNLGLLFRQTGDYQKAISHYDRAGALLQPKDRVANAKVVNNLGVCYQFLGEYEKARHYFEAALREYAANHVAKEATRTRLNLGRNYLLEGNAQVARATLDAALAEATAVHDPFTRADILDNLGQALLTAQKPQEALSLLNEALTAHQKLGDKRMESLDRFYLGRAHLQLGAFAAARKDLLESYEVRRMNGLRDSAIDSLFSLAELEFISGDATAARNYTARGLALIEGVRMSVPSPELRASFYARERHFLDLSVEVEAAPGNAHAVEDGFLSSDRGLGRVVLDLLTKNRSAESVEDEASKRRRRIQHQIDLLAARLSIAPGDEKQALRRRVEALIVDDERIDSGIQNASASEGNPFLGSVEELQRVLPSGSGLIEYHLGEKRSLLWLVEASRVQMFVLPSRKEIETLCAPVLELFSAVLERKRSPSMQAKFEASLRKLSAALLGPLAKSHLGGPVIMVPDGILTRLPLAALELPGGDRLGLAHDLVEVPSAMYLEAARTPRAVATFPRAILALADPVYSARDPRVRAVRSFAGSGSDLSTNLARLPYTADIDTLRTLIPASRRRILLGFDATAAAVRNMAPGEFAFLHLSTHAIVDDRLPELSRIALSMVAPDGSPIDGLIRPYHLSHLRLNGSTVVLAACETALGKQLIGEGLLGLATSLFAAGASQMIVTIASVDAEASAEFFSQTYANVFSNHPVPTEHAVTLARRALARSRRWSDPFYWASFAVYGRPTGPMSR